VTENQKSLTKQKAHPPKEFTQTLFDDILLTRLGISKVKD